LFSLPSANAVKRDRQHHEADEEEGGIVVGVGRSAVAEQPLDGEAGGKAGDAGEDLAHAGQPPASMRGHGLAEEIEPGQAG
jgi:hypothetical protein